MNENASPLPAAAQRYARAFYELAAEQKALPAVEGDLQNLAAMMKDSAELARLLASPLLRREVVARAVSALAVQAKFSPLTTQFLQVTVRNGRGRDMGVILEAFFALAAHARGEVVADVTAARAINQAQAEAIARALEGAMAGKGVKKVVVRSHVDKAVLGGVRVQIGSHLYDGTLKGKLQRLAQLLQNKAA